MLASLLLLATLQAAPKAETLALPPPVTEGGMPLMEALAQRHSQRDFSERALSEQLLSDLLWAAWGVNRPAKGKRTAPSAMNNQEIDLYLAREDGVFLYDAKAHALVKTSAQDLRRKTGKQGFAADVPLNLVYVVDYGRMRNIAADDRLLYAAADAGFISQNVYLFCASAGLATVTRGWLNREALAGLMGLGEEQQVLLVQSVGYPAGEE